jgi:hypothetical protein
MIFFITVFSFRLWFHKLRITESNAKNKSELYIIPQITLPEAINTGNSKKSDPLPTLLPSATLPKEEGNNTAGAGFPGPCFF